MYLGVRIIYYLNSSVWLTKRKTATCNSGKGELFSSRGDLSCTATVERTIDMRHFKFLQGKKYRSSTSWPLSPI